MKLKINKKQNWLKLKGRKLKMKRKPLCVDVGLTEFPTRLCFIPNTRKFYFK